MTTTIRIVLASIALSLPATARSWTGCFVGGQLGGVWSQSKNWTVRTPGGAFFGESLGGHRADGALGGIQTGCDYRPTGSLVLGIEGSFGWADAAGSHDSARETGVSYSSRVKSLASVTGRLGYARDRVIAYVRGGAAWEHDDYWATTTVLGTAYRARDTRSGWTVGAGAEYAVTPALTGFIEYGYYDFGTRDVALTPQVQGLPTGFVDITQSTNIVRVGFNYRFGAAPSPAHR